MRPRSVAFVVGQSVEVLGEPGGAPPLDAGEHRLALGGRAQADPAPVSGAGALDQPRRLEPGDVARHAGRRDALVLGQLGGGDPGVPLDLDQERDLPAGHAE